MPEIPPAGKAYLGSTTDGGVAAQESQFGRRLAVVHYYLTQTASWPSSNLAADKAAGRIPFVSWKPGTWSTVASGGQDSAVDNRCRQLRDLQHPVFFSIHHEPEDENGGTANYTAMWRRVVDRCRALGATNVAYVMVYMGWTFNTASGRNPEAWWAGDDYVDWVATDPYNWFGKPGAQWRTLQQETYTAPAFAQTHGKPLMLAEWGSAEDPAQPNRKAQWFAQSLAWMKTVPQIKAAVYFNRAHQHDWGTQDWRVNSTSQALTAWRTLAADPYFDFGAT
jgi:hypothetical protein